MEIERTLNQPNGNLTENNPLPFNYVCHYNLEREK